MKSSRLIYFPLFACLLIAALWSLYWYVAFYKAQESFTLEREKLAQRGVTLNCTKEGWGGYPFRFEYQCEGLSINAQHSAQMSTGKLLAVAQAYNPFKIIFLIDGPTHIADVDVSHERAMASLTFNLDQHGQFSLSMPKFNSPQLGIADELQFHARTQGPNIELASSAQNLTLPVENRPSLHIDAMAFEAQTAAALLASSDKLNFLAQSATPLILKNLKLQQGETALALKGQMALRPNYKINGIVSGSTNNLEGLLTLLQPVLGLTTAQLTSLKTLALFAPKTDGKTNLDLQVKDNDVLWGGMRVITLPPLH